MSALVVAVVNQKGGVGKTTVTLALAAEAARRNLRVLVIDADPQANATDTLALEAFDPDDAYTLYDVLDAGNLSTLGAAILDETRWEGVSLLPGDIQCARYDEWSMGAEQRLRKLLDAKLRRRFDLVLIDCPRALGALTAAALTAATTALIVAEPTKDALKGVAMTLETIDRVREHYNEHLVLDGIVLNRVGRTRAKAARAADLRAAFDPELVLPEGMPEWAGMAAITERGAQLPVVGDTREAQAGRTVETWLTHLLGAQVLA